MSRTAYIKMPTDVRLLSVVIGINDDSTLKLSDHHLPNSATTATAPSPSIIKLGDQWYRFDAAGNSHKLRNSADAKAVKTYLSVDELKECADYEDITQAWERRRRLAENHACEQRKTQQLQAKGQDKVNDKFVRSWIERPRGSEIGECDAVEVSEFARPDGSKYTVRDSTRFS